MKTTTWLTVMAFAVLGFTGCTSDPKNSYDSVSEYKKLSEKAKDLKRMEEFLQGHLSVIKAPAGDDYKAQQKREWACDAYLEFVRDYNRDQKEYGYAITRTRFHEADHVPTGESALPSGFPTFDPMPKELVKR